MRATTNRKAGDSAKTMKKDIAAACVSTVSASRRAQIWLPAGAD
jgi:hypothetical protein